MFLWCYFSNKILMSLIMLSNICNMRDEDNNTKNMGHYSVTNPRGQHCHQTSVPNTHKLTANFTYGETLSALHESIFNPVFVNNGIFPGWMLESRCEQNLLDFSCIFSSNREKNIIFWVLVDFWVRSMISLIGCGFMSFLLFRFWPKYLGIFSNFKEIIPHISIDVFFFYLSV